MNGLQIPLLISVVPICLFGMPQANTAQPAVMSVAAPNGTDIPNKFENGLQIFWRNADDSDIPNAADITDPEAPVRIFDSSFRELVVCQVMRAIREADPDATGVSIYDVSARRPGFIAVAAMYPRTADPPVAALLYFDWSGSLLHDVVLIPHPPIESLAIDTTGHLWTLNDSDSTTPTDSVFSEFDSAGSVIRNFVKPQKNWSTDESTSKGGQASFGLTAEKAWAWLPSSRTLVSVDKRTGKNDVYQTGLPHIGQNSNAYARQASLSADGRLLMEVGWQLHDGHHVGLFVWSSQTGWNRIDGPVQDGDGFLYGVSGDRLIFTSGNGFASQLIGSLLPRAEER